MPSRPHPAYAVRLENPKLRRGEGGRSIRPTHDTIVRLAESMTTGASTISADLASEYQARKVSDRAGLAALQTTLHT